MPRARPRWRFLNLWTGRALQEGCGRWGETVRINLSGLSMELKLRAKMGIRAHRACLDFRPHRAIFKTKLAVRRATVHPSCHILLANLGGNSTSGSFDAGAPHGIRAAYSGS